MLFLPALLLAILPASPLTSTHETGGALPTIPHAQPAPNGLSETEWAAVLHRISTHECSIRAAGNEHVAVNRGQRWSTRFDGRGFETTPASESWRWGLELESYGFARCMESVADHALATADGSRLVYQWNENLEEWYVNDERGLEHGYTLQQRPQVARINERTPLTLNLRVLGDLDAKVTSSGHAVHFQDKDGALTVTYSNLVVFDSTGREFAARFEGSGKQLQLLVDEREAVYPLTIDPVAQQAYIKASNTGTADFFGRSADISADTLVVGAYGERSNSLGVNGIEGDNSAPSAGAAYVFVRTGTSWSQQAYLKASNTEAVDFFGWAVTIDGDTIAVAAASKSTSLSGEASSTTGINGDETDNGAPGSGAVYIFLRTGTTWTQEAYIKASNAEEGDHFGASISLSSDTLIVGAPDEDSDAGAGAGGQADNSAPSAGAAYIFTRNGTTWTQQFYLKAFNSDAGDEFGTAVAVDGDTAVVGSPHEASAGTFIGTLLSGNNAQDAGAAYIFVRTGTSWAQQAYVKASNTGSGDQFGQSCTISNDTVCVGATLEDSSATGIDGAQYNDDTPNSGAAYVFVRNGTTWSQEAYLKASNTGAQDQFSSNEIDLDGNILAIGARGECGFSSGVNSDQSSDSPCFTPTGAIFVFERTGTTWEQLAYIKASTPTPGDGFASSVSVSGGTVVVGAPNDDSGATGINGNQNDFSSPGSGALYVFDLNAPLPTNAVGTATCFGDGGDQAGCVNCPCMNNATAGTTGGCRNSAFTSARLEALGDPSVSLPAGSNDDLRFSLSGVPPLGFCILNSGDGVAPTNMANPCFGVSTGVPSMSFDGLRCAVINTRRHGGRSADGNGNVGNTTSPWGGEGNPPIGIAQAGGGFPAGQTRFFQVIYRDDALLSCMRGLNTTQAIEISFTP